MGITESSITISDVQIEWEDIVGEKTLENGGYFGDLMQVARLHLEDALEKGRLTAGEVGAVYAAMIQSSAQQSINFALNKDLVEQRIKVAEAKAKMDEIALYIADATKEDKIDTSASNLNVLTGTEQFKIDLSGHQTTKALNDANLTAAQQKALEEQVIDNRKIKALSSLATTYGTFGAGGLTMDDEMWATYFSLIINLVDELRTYKGTWDAVTNTPNIDSTSPTAEYGDFYRVIVAGTTDLDGISSWAVDDIIFFDGTKWDKSSVLVPDTYNVTTAS